MTDTITLNIRSAGADGRWYFLQYDNPKKRHFEQRMLIEQRDDGWIGLYIQFPYTHENALDNLIKEVELAKEAISILTHPPVD